MPLFTRRSRASTFQIVSARLSKNCTMDTFALDTSCLRHTSTSWHRGLGRCGGFRFSILCMIVTLMPETALVSFRTLAFFFPLVTDTFSSFNAGQSLPTLYHCSWLNFPMRSTWAGWGHGSACTCTRAQRCPCWGAEESGAGWSRRTSPPEAGRWQNLPLLARRPGATGFWGDLPVSSGPTPSQGQDSRIRSAICVTALYSCDQAEALEQGTRRSLRVARPRFLIRVQVGHKSVTPARRARELHAPSVEPITVIFSGWCVLPVVVSPLSSCDGMTHEGQLAHQLYVPVPHSFSPPLLSCSSSRSWRSQAARAASSATLQRKHPVALTACCRPPNVRQCCRPANTAQCSTATCQRVILVRCVRRWICCGRSSLVKKGAAAMPIVFGAFNDTQIGAERTLTSLNAHSVWLPPIVSDLQRAVHATRFSVAVAVVVCVWRWEGERDPADGGCGVTIVSWMVSCLQWLRFLWQCDFSQPATVKNMLWKTSKDSWSASCATKNGHPFDSPTHPFLWSWNACLSRETNNGNQHAGMACKGVAA